MAGNSSENLQNDEPNDSITSIEDFHSYSKMKSYAKGLVDVALLTANASQLRYALEIDNVSMRIFLSFLISLSIMLQVST